MYFLWKYWYKIDLFEVKKGIEKRAMRQAFLICFTASINKLYFLQTVTYAYYVHLEMSNCCKRLLDLLKKNKKNKKKHQPKQVSWQHILNCFHRYHVTYPCYTGYMLVTCLFPLLYLESGNQKTIQTKPQFICSPVFCIIIGWF
jgi:hypothetical protein